MSKQRSKGIFLRMGFLTISVLLLSFVVLSCASKKQCAHPQTSESRKPASVTVQYADFKKILSPRSGLLPLPGGQESLILIKLPNDEYAKVYKLNHANHKFELQFDAGQNIAHVYRDHQLKRYFLLIDKLGDENFKLYSYNPESKKTKLLFGHEGFKVELDSFPNNADAVYLRSNHQDIKVYSVYRLNLLDGKFEQITDGVASWDNALVSPDEKTLILTQYKGNNESHVYRMDLPSKKTELILQKQGVVYEPEFFDPKKPILYLGSDEGRDRKACASVDVSETPTKLKWIRTDQKKDLSCYYSQTSKVTHVVELYDGRGKVRIFKDVFGPELKTPIPDKVIASDFVILPNEDTAFVRLESSSSPGDFYRFKVSARKNAPLEKISNLNMSGIDESKFGDSFDIKYKSFDGKEIHGIIYAKKEWLTDGSKHPMILWPHGGPDGLVRHDFSSYFQFWVLNGYVVFAPNFRGSIGYGKKFEKLNDRDWGGGHIKDLIWGKREMAKKPYIDRDHIYIVGRSFGGFSVLSTITQYPKEFRAAVAIVAIGNLFTFMKSIPPDPSWQGEFLAEVGDPVKDEALYRERSPYFHAEKIAIPLKIYQAENDTRTVKAEMDNFVARLKELKIPVEYEILEKEGHMPTRDDTWQMLLQGTIEFLNKN